MTSGKILITTITSWHSFARDTAIYYGINPDIVARTIKCESNWENVQSRLYNKHDHGSELSFGIAQIYLPAHPEISKTQALNKAFSINYMAKQISLGKGSQWTCFRLLNRKTTP